ncbi:MAG: hypothetical protein WB974_14615, partial [Acidobacteriaceae bacterium]
GTGWDRDAVAGMEAGHVCGEWKRAVESPARDERAGQQSDRLKVMREAGGSVWGQMRARLHPAILVLFIALLLYGVPTSLEILARSHVNMWVAVILPGDLAGCVVLGALEKMPRTATALYLLLTACECYWHVAHVMRGVTIAWIADLIPTLVVTGVLLVRMQRARATERCAIC